MALLLWGLGPPDFGWTSRQVRGSVWSRDTVSLPGPGCRSLVGVGLCDKPTPPPVVSPTSRACPQASNKLLHLLEAFSTTWFLFSAAQNHHLVFFLLEVFNNIIQYQFDGEVLRLLLAQPQ